jgi:hypothetical protein
MIRGILLVIGVILLIILIIFLVDQFLLDSTIGKKITNNPCVILEEKDCKVDYMCEPQYDQSEQASPNSEGIPSSKYESCDQKDNWSLILNWLNSKKLKKVL